MPRCQDTNALDNSSKKFRPQSSDTVREQQRQGTEIMYENVQCLRLPNANRSLDKSLSAVKSGLFSLSVNYSVEPS